MTHFDLSVTEFEKHFSAGTFPVSLFNHEAHLRLAWIHIHKYGVDRAIHNVTSQIQNFVRIHNAEDKYNHTLTIAAVKAVNHFYHRTEIKTFENTIQKFPRLKDNFKRLMEAHYSYDILANPRTKKQYLQPDLIPF